MPLEVYKKIKPDLSRFGELAVTDIARNADLCDMYLPQLTPIRPWGQKVDEITVHEAWNRLHAISATEGLIAIGYEREFGGKSHPPKFMVVGLESNLVIQNTAVCISLQRFSCFLVFLYLLVRWQ